MSILMWEVQKRGSSRSCQFSTRDMITALKRAGCIVEKHELPFLIRVTRELKLHEDPKTVRDDVTLVIRVVHPRATRIFKGLFE